MSKAVLTRAEITRSKLQSALGALSSHPTLARLLSLSSMPAANDNGEPHEPAPSGAALAVPSNDNGSNTQKQGHVALAVVIAGGTVLWADDRAYLPMPVHSGSVAIHDVANKGTPMAGGHKRAKLAVKRKRARLSSKAVTLVSTMMHDFHWNEVQSAAAVGWMAAETGDFTMLQEMAYKGVHSGYGWPQWTGQRRIKYFGYVVAHHLDAASDDANYGFLTSELSGPYRRAVVELSKTTTLASASYTWGHYYEGMSVDGPGVPAWKRHLDWAQWVLSEYQASNH